MASEKGNGSDNDEPSEKKLSEFFEARGYKAVTPEEAFAKQIPYLQFSTIHHRCEGSVTRLAPGFFSFFGRCENCGQTGNVEPVTDDDGEDVYKYGDPVMWEGDDGEEFEVEGENLGLYVKFEAEAE